MTSEVIDGATRAARGSGRTLAAEVQMRALLLLVTVPFAAFTGSLVLRIGYLGFWEWLLSTPQGWQVFIDICIALFLVLSWIRRDAQASGRRYWPYVALTIALGSLGPLTYLVLRPRRAAATTRPCA